MPKSNGLLSISANFDVNIAAPFDSKNEVDYKSDLIASGTFNNYQYKGMVVSVVNDTTPSNNGVYWLNTATHTSYSAWDKLGGSNNKVIVVTGTTYTIDICDDVIVFNSASSVAVTLPSTPASDLKFTLVNKNTGVVTANSTTINQDQSMLLVYDLTTTAWYSIILNKVKTDVVDLKTVPSGSSATTQDGLNSEFDTSIKSKAIAVTSPTGNYLLKQNSTSNQLEETLVPTTAFNIYDVPQATKTALDTNSNWLTGGVVNKTFNYIGDQGMEYINTTLGWNYKCILSGVWTRQIIGVTYVDMYDIPSTEKTKLTTAGNWTGVNYTGTLITGCYKGQRWYSSAYIYEFYADNLPIRSARV